MKNEPCKLTFEHWGESVFVGKGKSDVTTDECVDLFVMVMIASGFTKDQIDTALIEYIERLESA